MDKGAWKKLAIGTVKEYAHLKGYRRRTHRGTWKDVIKGLAIVYGSLGFLLFLAYCIQTMA